jgi:hypothetical protein
MNESGDAADFGAGALNLYTLAAAPLTLVMM